MTDFILELDHLCKEFPVRGMGRGGQTLRAVDDVSLAVAQGETLGIVGESGCGKTTLGRLVLRLTEPTGGSIRFRGDEIRRFSRRDMKRFRRHVQMVFQDPYSSLNPRMRVGEIIGEPLENVHVPRSEARHRVAETMELVGLSPASASRFPHAFSGGQRQRIGIARALVVRPSVLVCDEAVSALDVSVQAQILNLLQTIQRRVSLTIVFISHSLGVIRFLSDRIAVMYLGRIVEHAPESALFSAPQHPYTRALISAVPEPDPAWRGQRRILSGEMPNPADPPPGCPFHPRCPIARERCAREFPRLRTQAPGHTAACHYPGSQHAED